MIFLSVQQCKSIDMPGLLLKLTGERDPTLYQAATALEASGMGLYFIAPQSMMGMTQFQRALVGAGIFFSYSTMVDGLPYQ
jgi:hypothetical protein